MQRRANPTILVVSLIAGGCIGSIAAEEAAAPTPGAPRIEEPPQPGDDPPPPAVAGAPSTTPPVAPGNPVTPGGPAAPMERCAPAAGEARLRPLDAIEYANTLRDLFGDLAPAAVDLPAEPGVSFVERARDVAEAIAAKAAADPAKLAGCAGGESCAAGFIARLGRRVFRRPLTSDEVAAHVAVWRTESDFRAGIELVTSALLQSPHFLYLPVLGTPVAGSPSSKLTPHELAARLAYFLADSTPDDALSSAADSGALANPAEVARQARRLLASPRMRAVLATFHEGWLEYEAVAGAMKDQAAYGKAFDAELGALMRDETTTFLERAFAAPGYLDAILSARHGFMNRRLATFYGVPGVTSTGLEKVSLAGTPRLGVLTHGAVMASRAYPDQTDPIHRGLLVRTQLMCGEIPPPVGLDDMVVVPPRRPGETSRERFTRQMQLPGCGACHALINPLGFAFEHFDAIGRYRTVDEGKSVDATGEILGSDVDGTFDGVPGLVERLKRSGQVERCVATRWFRFGLGRDEVPADACTLSVMRDAFARSGQDPREMLVALVQTPTFLHRTPTDR